MTLLTCPSPRTSWCVWLAVLVGSCTVEKKADVAEPAPPAVTKQDGLPYGAPLRSPSKGYATDVLLLDLDGDSWLDAIISNGNDMKAEAVELLWNREGALFHDTAVPIDSTPRYHTALAAGDLGRPNGGPPDGIVDFVVSIPFGDDDDGRSHDLGGLMLFFGAPRGEVAPSTGPFHPPSEPFPPTGPGPMGGESPMRASIANAVGDLNGDGLLDLVIARAEMTPDIGDLCIEPGPIEVYLNHPIEGLSPTPAWSSSNVVAPELLITDMDGDGWMDLVAAAWQPMIFYGRDPASGGELLDGSSASIGGPFAGFRYGLDAASLDGGPQQALVVAETDFNTDVDTCPWRPNIAQAINGFRLYLPSPSTAEGAVPNRSYECEKELSSTTGTPPSPVGASKARFADLDADGMVDIVVGHWWNTASEDGSKIRLYAGLPAGFPGEEDRPYPYTPTMVLDDEPTAQGIGIADLRRRGLEEYCHVVLPRGRSSSTVTLPVRVVEGITGVWIDGESLSSADYARTPDGNTISIGRCSNGKCRRIDADETVTVRYAYSTVKDLVVADWQPNQGSLLYYSEIQPGPCPTCKACPANLR